MDELLDLDNFPVLRSPHIEDKLKSLRLLAVFGLRGHNVIFATNDDIVFGFGGNENACLGLGHWNRDIAEPQVIKNLCHQNVVDIAIGYQHCLGLTASGQVFSWGQNNFGELGTDSDRGAPYPKNINKIYCKVVQICCGDSFSLALTSDGCVYGWGRNTYNQFGLIECCEVWLPRKLPLKEPITSICCGRLHSMALTASGQVYVWGVFKDGGVLREASPDPDQKGVSYPLKSFEDMSVIKIVCGPAFSLFLTSKGRVYAYGCNIHGQVGKGSFGAAKAPVRIGEHIIFKDIIASKADNLSIGVSKDNEYFVWGFVDNTKVFSPKRVKDPSFRSVFDVYAMSARSKVTFKTAVVSQAINPCNQITGDFNELNNCEEKVISPKNGFIDYNIKCDNKYDNSLPEEPSLKSGSENESFIANSQSISVTSETVSEKVSKKSFNNCDDFDLKLIFKDNLIYCHKSILEFRNDKFWQKCKNQFKNENRDEIRIKAHFYESFLSFVGYLYGQSPEITEENCAHLSKMADLYDEPELKELCQQFLNKGIDLSTVCSLYENAVKTKSTELQKSCIEFVMKNIKLVFNSEAFLSMDAMISVQLIHEINNLIIE